MRRPILKELMAATEAPASSARAVSVRGRRAGDVPG